MPNHDKTRLTITGKPESLLAFAQQYRTSAKPDSDDSTKTVFCLSDAFVPMPPEMVATFGTEGISPPWYRWAEANWGTKWGTYRESHVVSDDRIIIDFESAWNPPWKLLATIRQAFPDLDFSGTTVAEYDDIIRRFKLDDDGKACIEDLGEFSSFTEEKVGDHWVCTTTQWFDMDGNRLDPPAVEIDRYPPLD